MDGIKSNSEKRVAENPVFSKIEQYARYLKEIRDVSETPLDMEDLNALEKERKEHSKKFEGLEQVNEKLKVSNYQKDLEKIQIDSTLIAGNKEEMDNIQTDVYINEALWIINDLIEAKP